MATFWPGSNLAAEIVDDGLFRRVAKADVVEGDLAVDGGRVGTAGRISQLVLLFLAQKFKHTFRRGSHALQHVGYLRQLLDGLGEVFDVLDERLDVTDGDSTGGSKNTARPQLRPRTPGCPQSS